MSTNTISKISTKEKLGFMSYSAASNIVYNFKGTYYLIFLTAILQVPIATAGIMFAIGTIWDAVNDPLITILSTNHKFKNGEKVRPYALYYSVPWALSVILLFTNFNLSEGWTIALGITAYFIFEALNTFINIPYNAMASLATNNEADRVSINSFRGLGSCLGSLIGAVAIIPLIKLFGGLQNGGNSASALTPADSTAFTLTVSVLAVLIISGALIHYFTTKERVKDSEDVEEERIGIFKGYKILFKCKTWILNVLYIVGYSISTALVMNNINYYAQYNLEHIEYSTYILAVYLVLAIATALLIPKISEKIGRKKAMIYPLIIMAVTKIPFIIAPNLVTVMINSFGCGIGLTATFILLNANRNSISDILEAQNGRRVDALIAGGDGLIDKGSQALTIFAFTQVLSKLGFDKNAVKIGESAMNGIQFLIGWMPLIVCLLLILITFFIDPKKELEKYKK